MSSSKSTAPLISSGDELLRKAKDAARYLARLRNGTISTSTSSHTSTTSSSTLPLSIRNEDDRRLEIVKQRRM
jgi:hypothetical protein